MRLLIDGEWVDAASGRRDEIRDKATGELIDTAPHGGVPDVMRAIEAAHESANQRPVLVPQAVGVGAFDHLLGALRGEPVEILVSVHGAPVQVLALAGGVELGAPVLRVRSQEQFFP